MANSGVPMLTEAIEARADFDRPPVTPKRLRLMTARDIRRELARTYGQLARREIERGEATARGFLLATLCRVIANSEFEARLARLEHEKQS
jgi:predicted ABC-class ATPase